MALVDLPIKAGLGFGRSGSPEAKRGTRPKHMPTRSPLDKYFVAGEEVNSTKWEGLVIEDANQGIPLMDERELTEIPDSLKTAMQSLLIVSMLVGGAIGGPGGVKQIIEGYPQSTGDGKPPKPDHGDSPDSGGSWKKPITILSMTALAFLEACSVAIQGEDESQPTPETTEELSTPVARVIVVEDTPVQEPGLPTPLPTDTPESVAGSPNKTFYAVPGVPVGFEREGRIVTFYNNQQIQDNLIKEGYAPIFSRGGALSWDQFYGNHRVCDVNLPDKLVSQAIPGGEDLKMSSESGIVSYGDTESNQVRVKAVGAVSVKGLPVDWHCVNTVVKDKDNPVGLGALRMLVIDSEGNIWAEMPAAFSGEDAVELRWEETGLKLFVDGDMVDFKFRQGVEESLPTPEPVLGEPLGDFEYNFKLYRGSEDSKSFIQPFMVSEKDMSGSGIADSYTSLTLAITRAEQEEGEWKIEMGFIYEGRLYSYPVEFGGYPVGGTDKVKVTSMVSFYPDGYFYPRDTTGKHIKSGLMYVEQFASHLQRGDIVQISLPKKMKTDIPQGFEFWENWFNPQVERITELSGGMEAFIEAIENENQPPDPEKTTLYIMELGIAVDEGD